MNYKIKRRIILEYLTKRSRNVEGMLLVSVSRRQISKRLGYSKSSIWRAIRYLIWAGFLKIYRKHSYVNIYRIINNKTIS